MISDIFLPSYFAILFALWYFDFAPESGSSLKKYTKYIHVLESSYFVKYKLLTKLSLARSSVYSILSISSHEERRGTNFFLIWCLLTFLIGKKGFMEEHNGDF